MSDPNQKRDLADILRETLETNELIAKQLKEANDKIALFIEQQIVRSKSVPLDRDGFRENAEILGYTLNSCTTNDGRDALVACLYNGDKIGEAIAGLVGPYPLSYEPITNVLYKHYLQNFNP